MKKVFKIEWDDARLALYARVIERALNHYFGLSIAAAIRVEELPEPSEKERLPEGALSLCAYCSKPLIIGRAYKVWVCDYCLRLRNPIKSKAELNWKDCPCYKTGKGECCKEV